MNNWPLKSQKFNRTEQRWFVFRQKDAGLYIREGKNAWTLNVELAHLFLGEHGRIEYSLDAKFVDIADIEPVEVIPKLNGNVSFNIKGDE